MMKSSEKKEDNGFETIFEATPPFVLLFDPF